MPFSLRYFGTNSICIQGEGTAILVDPYFTRASRGSMLKKISPDPQRIRRAMHDHSIARVDAILITHSHYDHALDAVEVAKQFDAVLYGSDSMGMIARASGLPEGQFRLLQPDAPFRIGEFKVTALPVSHLDFPGPFDEWIGLNEKIREPLSPPAWFWQFRSGQVYAFLLQQNDVRLLLNGSAGLFETRPAISAETAVLCIGGMGWKSMANIRDWFQEMVLGTGVRQLHLAHYDDFTRPLEEPLRWIPGTGRALRLVAELAEAHPGLHMQVLPLLDTIRIG